MNCLNQAISEERTHQVRLLLSMDVDGDMKDKHDSDRTPLIKSCLVAHAEPSLKLLKILLKFDVSINAIDNLGRSALHYACSTGKSEVAKVLMNEDGIELNNQDNEGRTPLMLACAEGHLVMARVLMGKLVKFDLEIDVRDNQGYTALLLAIKNEHYDVSHDLVRYANACTTLRDNEKFMNAAEWLKSNLEARRKTKHESKEISKESKTRKRNTKTPTNTEKHDEEDDDVTEQHDDVPILTLTESGTQETTDVFENDSSTMPPETARSVAAMSGLLFEPDPYGSFKRPPSSGRTTSAKDSPGSARPPSSGREISTRPWTGDSTASSTRSQRFSASSRTKQLQKLEQLREEGVITPDASPVPNRTVENLKRESVSRSAVSNATSRGRRLSRKLDDLESIVEDPDSRQPSRAGGRESVSRGPSRQKHLRVESKTPASSRSKSPYNNNNQTVRRSKMEKLKEEKSSEIYAIQKLKQALRDKTRRKITRATTAVFRPASGTPSEQWMSEIITGSKRPPATVKSAHLAPKSPDTERPPTQQRKQSIRSSSSAISYSGSRKPSTLARFEDTSPAMRLLHASSNLSLDTLLSQSDVTASTAYYPASDKSKKSKNSNQLHTIFRLYTDSCLWKPPVQKSASLSVQQCDNSEKMTLHSEMSDSIGELGNDILGSTTGSIPPRARPESKIAARNRLISGSATSRISRGSRNSAGGRSVASRHAD